MGSIPTLLVFKGVNQNYSQFRAVSLGSGYRVPKGLNDLQIGGWKKTPGDMFKVAFGAPEGRGNARGRG